MPFVASYQTIEPCLVAVVHKFSQSAFPEIVGTGFFTSQNGVVCTCRHVINEFASLPRHEGFAGIAADVLLFREVEINGRRKWAWFVIEILAAGDTTFEGGRPDFVPGDEDADTSFLLVNATQTPSVSFSDERLVQGEAIAFAGFPMGTPLLRAPTGFRQLSPSLHSGIVSAIFPDRVAETPYGFLLHANTQGGASGSPVFRSDGAVCGMVYLYASPRCLRLQPGRRTRTRCHLRSSNLANWVHFGETDSSVSDACGCGGSSLAGTPVAHRSVQPRRSR